MMNFKKLSLTLGTVVLALGFAAGCSNTSNKNTDTLSAVKKSGELKIGTEGTYAPFTFHDKNGNLTGFDIDLSNEVAKRLGVKPKYFETQWDSMFAGLNSSRFDMIANEVGIKPDRQKEYLFSEPYSSSSAALVVPSSNNKIKSFNDIKGLKSAQSLTSNYTGIAKQYGAQIVGIEGFSQAIQLIESNRADVTINDKLAVQNYLTETGDKKVKIAALEKDTSSSGFMFRKTDDSLVKAVNKALDDMKKDGTYNRIVEKWFGKNGLK
ncbi:amino acid ABC transporter substrate-binding protein [Bacillus sp. RG28]|uniref:Amino acid ABC transporter substrate-binding protein n=2 Tax=Gottfriedia endophytica TaxID=2820819 RepID=A0A940NTP2_9BACI|nr:amino acid ABC transporter substrate-binding protein [Gottfriedia endophytica]